MLSFTDDFLALTDFKHPNTIYGQVLPKIIRWKIMKLSLGIVSVAFLAFSSLSALSLAQGVKQVTALNRVTVSGTMEIVDDEVINRRNERAILDVSGTAVVGLDPSSLVRMEGCAGGEVRVELALDVQGADNGMVRVVGTASMYEGTSCTTRELEDTETIRLTIPANQYTPYTVNLNNSETFGGDTARITLNFHNAVLN
jgi:hypothetical protein